MFFFLKEVIMSLQFGFEFGTQIVWVTLVLTNNHCSLPPPLNRTPKPESWISIFISYGVSEVKWMFFQPGSQGFSPLLPLDLDRETLGCRFLFQETHMTWVVVISDETHIMKLVMIFKASIYSIRFQRISGWNYEHHVFHDLITKCGLVLCVTRQFCI